MTREARVHVSMAVLLGLSVPVIQYIGFFWFQTVIPTSGIILVGVPVCYAIGLAIIRTLRLKGGPN